MTDQEKWVEALARLTRKTLEGEIRWQSVPAGPIARSGLGGIDKAFETVFRDQRIRVFRESTPSPLGPLGRGYQFVIEFLDSAGSPAYRPPLLDGSKDLFSAIEYQSARVGDFIDALIRD